MIIKGGSRGGPTQLAWHLQRRDTNEKIKILELQSPVSDLKEAFRDWQILSEGTKGFKGLYHANIDPAKGYTMTPEQWSRAIEVLEEELGFQGQPRAVVMHEKHGRTHIHVVWARTDIDRMVLRSDSQNYMAHERASQRLELEFGHEMVPGKHAKRDREKQPEFPKAEANQAEWQQAERTGVSVAERKQQVTALKASCDSGQSFKAALEEHGYILAQGDRRNFVIVDETGSIHSLGRQLQDMKAAELRAFMKDVDKKSLPTAEDAVALQRQRQEERKQGALQEEVKQEETRKKKQSDAAPKEKQDTDITLIDQADEWAAYYGKVLEGRLYRLQRMDSVLEALLDRQIKKETDAYVEGQRQELKALVDRIKAETSGIWGYIKARESRLNPTVAAEKAKERSKEILSMKRRLGREQRDYLKLVRQSRKLDLDEVKEQPAKHLLDTVDRIKAEASEDLATYLFEAERYARVIKDWADAEKDRQREEEERANIEPQPEQAAPQEPKREGAEQKAEAPEPQPQEPAREAEKPSEAKTQETPSDTPPEPVVAAPDPEKEALTKATLERQEQERQKTLHAHKAELDQLRQALDRDNGEKVQRFEAMQQKAMDALLSGQKQEAKGFRGLLESVRNFFSRSRAREREVERHQAREDLARRQKSERDEFMARLAREDEIEVDDLKERQALYQQEQTAKGKQELERYLRELDEARALKAEYEEQEKKREEELVPDDDLEKPPPKITK